MSVTGADAGKLSPIKHPVGAGDDYTDGRILWDWKSRYPIDAQRQMKCEAIYLALILIIALLIAGLFLGLVGQPLSIEFRGAHIGISARILAIFFVGCVGGITFSIKWLIHSIAKGKWHEDRRYWRYLVPLVGGVYASVVLTLWGSGFLATPSNQQESSLTTAASLAFLVGYFSDGVSGLLSNVANAVFGTVEKK